jgi:hemoglobin/transferrin/lactoferrin receptor protein
MKMKLIKYTSLSLLLILSQITHAQINKPDTSQIKTINLNEVVISVNKIEESKRTVAQYVEVLTSKEIMNSQAQTTAELLSNTAGIFVQKSQLGGGSPVIRGFEASRILLVVDGVRMNNIIYRAGHLQNVITLDNNVLNRTEILFGPSSTVYGSDALGGVIHFYTRQPLLALDGNKTNIKVNFLSRYGSVDNELTNHLDFNIGTKKFASLTSFTYSIFDDLKGGKNQNPFYTTSFGERPNYVERIKGQDSLVKNSDRYLQVQSGYSQYDLLQKFLFQQNEHLSHGINIQFSNSTDVPRYDRLTDPKGNGLNYAQWYYGPQTRLLTAYDLNLKNPDAKFQNIHLGISYQNIEESRHTRKFGKDNLSHRTEKVNVLGVDLDFQKIIKSNNIRFGFDGQFNTLKSTANEEDIVTGSISPLDTRYPDGNNTMLNSALYFSHTWHINEKLILTDGIRVGFSMLHSTFVDTSFYHFPYTEVTQNNPVYSGSIGIINNPTDDWKLSLQFSTGYRVPNVDDLSKVFESSAGSVIVPNPDLKPEQTFNSELGITKIFGHSTRWENSIYYTRFFDAIVTDKFTFNGQDSIIYDGEMSQVMANQNKENAYIYGFSSAITSQCNENFLFSFMMNYTYGRIKTDTSDYPLDHIPPFMARLQLMYTNKNFSSDFYVNYNGWKKLKNYNMSGEDNQQYATPDGMPAWFTVNFRASYKVYKMLTLQAGVDNIFDTQYRTFASGINAPGRNIYGSIRFNF